MADLEGGLWTRMDFARGLVQSVIGSLYVPSNDIITPEDEEEFKAHLEQADERLQVVRKFWTLDRTMAAFPFNFNNGFWHTIEVKVQSGFKDLWGTNPNGSPRYGIGARKYTGKTTKEVFVNGKRSDISLLPVDPTLHTLTTRQVTEADVQRMLKEGGGQTIAFLEGPVPNVNLARLESVQHYRVRYRKLPKMKSIR